MTKLKIYIGLLILLFAVIIVLDRGRPRPIDWRPTYSTNDKIPLGLYILNNEIDNLTDYSVSRFDVTPYEYLEQSYDYDSLVADYNIDGTILSIAQPIDDESAKELFYFVSRYNSAFLSMKTFPKLLLDSLKLEVGNKINLTDSIPLWMANPQLGSEKYYFAEDAGNSYFSKIDPANTTILGYQGTDSARANFIKVRYQNGDFYLHTQPAAFSNFHLLKPNHRKYAENVLAYLPEDNIYWYTRASETGVSASPLRYVFGQPALAWAWYLFVFGMLFFMFFNAKRKQRIVPVITPLRNTTVEFAKTIGNLYYQEGDHDTIIDKKIIYFLERIRSEYLIDTSKLDDDFIRKLHQKSGKDILLIERAVLLINMHRKSYHGSVEDDLIQINNAIEKIIH